MSDEHVCIERAWKILKLCSIQDIFYVKPMRNIYPNIFDQLLFRSICTSSTQFMQVHFALRINSVPPEFGRD